MQSIYYRKVGDVIRQHRRKLNMTIKESATELGISHVTMIAIEYGRQQLPLYRAMVACDVLSIDPMLLVRAYTEARSKDRKILDMPENIS